MRPLPVVARSWLSYSMLAWLPTFFTSTLSVDLSQAAQTALLPPLAGMAASAVAGPLADWLVERGGLSLGAARKLLQGASFLGPCALLLAAGSGGVAGDRALTLACVTGALGLNSLALGGLYCTHQVRRLRSLSVAWERAAAGCTLLKLSLCTVRLDGLLRA